MAEEVMVAGRGRGLCRCSRSNGPRRSGRCYHCISCRMRLAQVFWPSQGHLPHSIRSHIPSQSTRSHLRRRARCRLRWSCCPMWQAQLVGPLCYCPCSSQCNWVLQLAWERRSPGRAQREGKPYGAGYQVASFKESCEESSEELESATTICGAWASQPHSSYNRSSQAHCEASERERMPNIAIARCGTDLPVNALSFNAIESMCIFEKNGPRGELSKVSTENKASSLKS